jgi:hypothetical protein
MTNFVKKNWLDVCNATVSGANLADERLTKTGRIVFLRIQSLNYTFSHQHLEQGKEQTRESF